MVTLLLAVGIFFCVVGFLLGCFYTRWQMSQKGKGSSFGRSLKPIPANNMQQRTPNQSPTNVINAYDVTPKANEVPRPAILPFTPHVGAFSKGRFFFFFFLLYSSQF